ncbi:MAG: hypothetical protein AAF572_11670 [Cyanobacteria bacterium P01_B01_bin.77]
MKTSTASDGTLEIAISFDEAVAKGWSSPGGLILSGHPIFQETLNTPSWDILNPLRFGESSNQRHVVFGADGLMRQATDAQVDCYLYEGEYKTRLLSIEDNKP